MNKHFRKAAWGAWEKRGGYNEAKSACKLHIADYSLYTNGSGDSLALAHRLAPRRQFSLIELPLPKFE